MTASPLGRYAQHADGEPLHEVRLLNLPVRLMQDGRDRHDSLLREFALLSFADDPERSPRLTELTALLGVRFGAAQQRPDRMLEEALQRGRDSVDAAFEVPASVVDAATRLEALMAEADELCRTEDLLTLPRNPLQLRFSAWYLDELCRQVAGEPPRPWDGPLDP